jgi:UDP-2,3-diacylglucosamine pyrophosphatase LpxH
MKIATLFLSDLHMGVSRQSFQGEELLACLQAYEPEKIIINGDFLGTTNVDPTDAYYKSALIRWLYPFVWEPVCEQILERFAELAAQGTEIVLLTGNHDHHIEAQMAEGREYLAFSALEGAGKPPFRDGSGARFDGIFRLGKPHVHTTRRGVKLWIEHGHAHADVHPDHILIEPLAAYILSGQRRAGALKRWYLYQCLQVDRKAIAMARKMGADGSLTGHYHTPDACTVMLDGQPMLYMNTGDWIGNATAAFERMDGELVMVSWWKGKPVEAPVVFSRGV